MLADAPTWTLTFLTANWAEIQRAAPDPTWMPVELPGSAVQRRQLDELGCGHYGCVFATHAPGIVCKISSDPSEAEFVKAAVKLGTWPGGIVRYRGILDLTGSFRHRPLFLIWREEAFDIGFLRSANCRAARNPHACQEFGLYHKAYRNAASYVRTASTKSGWATARVRARAEAAQAWAWKQVTWEMGRIPRNRPGRPEFMTVPAPYRLAAALHICATAFELMANTDYATAVGDALHFYLEQGILLADVHFQNIGKVRRDEGYGPEEITVITDPGHAVFVGPS